MSLISEFKEFAMKGSVVDLAVGVIIGAAFGAVVSSFVTNVMMPPLGWLISGVNFEQLSIRIPTSDVAGDDVEILYGKFLNDVIKFVIQALAIFLVIKGMNSLRREKDEVADEPAEPTLTTEEKLLTEIRDALVAREGAARVRE